MSILEWKWGMDSVNLRDVEWLKSFSLAYPQFVGYAITANPPSGRFKLSCTRVEAGKVQPGFVYLI
jgi:hypothetical protein